jgi:hypothetical protein
MGLDNPTPFFPLPWQDQGTQMGENRLGKFYHSIDGGHPWGVIAKTKPYCDF